MFKNFIKNFIKKYFDYDIVGEYLEPVGNGRYKKRYIQEWHLRRKKK